MSESFVFRLCPGHHCQSGVVVGSTMEFLDLLVCKRPHSTCRDTHRERPGRDDPVLRNQGCCGYHCFVTNSGSREDGGVHAYHGVVADCTAVQDGAVADSGTFADNERNVDIYVPYHVVLDVRISVHDDGCNVATEDHPIPDAGTFLNGHISYQDGRVGDKCRGGYGWSFSVKRTKNTGHQCSSLCCMLFARVSAISAMKLRPATPKVPIPPTTARIDQPSGLPTRCITKAPIKAAQATRTRTMPAAPAR